MLSRGKQNKTKHNQSALSRLLLTVPVTSRVKVIYQLFKQLTPSAVTLLHFLIRPVLTEHLFSHRNWARLCRFQQDDKRPLGRVIRLVGNKHIQKQLEGNVRVLRQARNSVMWSLCRRGHWLYPRGKASGRECPCPTALCIAKADRATAFEVALSLPASYGQKQMQT